MFCFLDPFLYAATGRKYVRTSPESKISDYHVKYTPPYTSSRRAKTVLMFCVFLQALARLPNHFSTTRQIKK